VQYAKSPVLVLGHDEVDSEEDEEPTPKKPRSGVSKPSGSKPTVDISGPSQATSQSPVSEMVTLLRELAGEVRELMKVTRGVSGLGVQIYQQNAKLIRLGERQSQLAERLVKKGLGSGSEKESEDEGAGSGKDKGKAKDETMRDSGLDDDERMHNDDGVSESDEDTEK
jgi:hypothetical protein